MRIIGIITLIMFSAFRITGQETDSLTISNVSIVSTDGVDGACFSLQYVAQSQFQSETAALSCLNIKNNVVLDMLAIPNVTLEMIIAPRWAVTVGGTFAWWSRESDHKFWRLYGGTLGLGYNIKPLKSTSFMSGHTVYASFSTFTYDFKHTHYGYMGSKWNYSASLGYSFAFPIARRLNLEASAAFGLNWGPRTKYEYECGRYMCVDHRHNVRFGLTDFQINLVWLIGRDNFNR